MPKIIVVKKPSIQDTRRCLNCGANISNKKKGAKFCSRMCWNSYYNYWRNYENN